MLTVLPCDQIISAQRPNGGHIGCLKSREQRSCNTYWVHNRLLSSQSNTGEKFCNSDYRHRPVRKRLKCSNGQSCEHPTDNHDRTECDRYFVDNKAHKTPRNSRTRSLFSHGCRPEKRYQHQIFRSETRSVCIAGANFAHGSAIASRFRFHELRNVVSPLRKGQLPRPVMFCEMTRLRRHLLTFCPVI